LKSGDDSIYAARYPSKMSDIASSSLEPPVIGPVCTVLEKKTVVHDDVLECEDEEDDEPVDPRIKVTSILFNVLRFFTFLRPNPTHKSLDPTR